MEKGKFMIKAEMITIGGMYQNTLSNEILTVLSKTELPNDALLISCLLNKTNGEQTITKAIYAKQDNFPGFLSWKWRELS